MLQVRAKALRMLLANLKEALELYLEDEDFEKPSFEAEVPIVTIVKVDLRGSSHNSRSKGN
jgi:hypothetical protein